jgi:hypothetical protein
MNIAQLVLAAVLLAGPRSADNGAPSPPCSVSNTVFSAGEKFTFKVYYNWTAVWLSAGEIAFTAKDAMLNDRPVHHLTAMGETYKSYEWFYKVKDKYESWVDKASMMPLEFKRDAFEGGYVMKDEFKFDRDAGKVHVKELHGWDHKVKGQPMKERALDVPACVHDPVSAIYYLRCLDFSKVAVGEKVPFDVYIDGAVYHVYARYMGKKTIKTRLGKFNTLWIKPLMVKNDYFDGGEQMNVYVTDDDNKIPVRVETPLTVGVVKADLISYSGLKHPFLARAK